MSADLGLTNGFRIKALNADCDRLAIQSSVQTTRWCSYRRLLPRVHEVGITQNELIVLRAYQGAPTIELEGLGGPHGVLIVEPARGGRRVLRNGTRHVLELGRDEAVVIKTERWRAPGSDGASFRGV